MKERKNYTDWKITEMSLQISEITSLNLSGRTIQMENEGEWYYERTKSILEQDASQWTTDDISFLEEALSEA